MAAQGSGGGDAGRSGGVSREQYELLLEEAQVVERERLRLEDEFQASALERARLETELSHERRGAERARGEVERAAEEGRELARELAAARTERAVTEARLETLAELRERVASLEEANNQLAFALRDSGQGVRQMLLEAGGRSPRRPLHRRPGLWLGAAALVLVCAALGLGGAQLGSAVRAAERRAADERERDRAARLELLEALRGDRRDTREWLESQRAADEADRERAEAAARAREERLAEELERRTALLPGEWAAERRALVGALEEFGAELRERASDGAEDAEPPAPPHRDPEATAVDADGSDENGQPPPEPSGPVPPGPGDS